jgi:hypothetical protein
MSGEEPDPLTERIIGYGIVVDWTLGPGAHRSRMSGAGHARRVATPTLGLKRRRMPLWNLCGLCVSVASFRDVPRVVGPMTFIHSL